MLICNLWSIKNGSGLLMMYLMLDVQSTNDIENCSQLNAWVNVNNHAEAMEILYQELSQEGWALTNIIESITTDESDYFPPCPSLNAYNQAKQELLALRFL